MVAQSMLDGSFSNLAANMHAAASAVVDTLADVPLRGWVVIGLLFWAAQIVWGRSSR